MKTSSKHALACLAAGVALVGSATLAAAQDVSLNVAQAYPKSFAVLGHTPTDLAERMDTASGGSLTMKIFDPGALVPVLETFDAVAKGAVDAGYTAGTFWAGKDVTFNMYSAIPFGPATEEYLAWMQYGGGLALQDELYAAYNLKSILCGVVTPEAAGWFNKEIASVEDLAGLKMRIAGLGAQILERVGVSPQLMAPGDIYAALDRGVIDATEFSTPAADLTIGFDEVAKYYYFPGWHQQSAFAQLLINLDTWNGLSDQHKTLIEMGCEAAITNTLAEGESLQAPALAELESRGVEIKTLPEPLLAALGKEWNAVSEALAGQSETFRKAWDSYSTFRDGYAKWRGVGYLR
ncbi:MAG: TRAP transporter substrate-binding protein [Acuticoccus sp.]